MPKKLQERTNHIAIGVDSSESMDGQPVVKVFDKYLNTLKRMSIDFNQETRISLYTFNHGVRREAFDMDIMRFETLEGLWTPSGSTALRDCIGQIIRDHKLIPQFHGDHAFMLYFITDGEENASRNFSVSDLKRSLGSELPDNWTLAGLVPSKMGRTYLEGCGFPSDSIDIWNTAEAGGFEKVGKQFDTAMGAYMSARATGVKSVKGLFTLDSSGLTRQTAKKQLTELPTKEYTILPVRAESPIKEYVEKWLGSYRLGSAYYQPTKKVKIQDYKNILVQDAKNGKVYEGSNLRQLLGLPDATVEVDPGQHKDWRIFVQSTSVNRKLFANTFVLVRN